MENTPCNPDRECRYRESGCFEDTHHEYFPAYKYKDKVSKAFRELAMNKVELCRAIHDDFHAVNTPPKKPKRDVMLRAIDSNATERNIL